MNKSQYSVVLTRCAWLTADPIYINYHDQKWGVPMFDDQKLFEKLCLEGAQAGLSWITILKKREAYRQAFFDFDIQIVANLSDTELEIILKNKNIVRNRLKIWSCRSNAQAFLRIQAEFGSFAAYWWAFVENKTITNHYPDLSQVPPQTPLSETIAKDLKKRGFTFVGATIVYSMMQSTGLVNDHTTDCFRHQEIIKKQFISPLL